LTARESRILVTHDRRTIPQHFATFVQTQTSSGVIIVSKKLAIQQVVDDLILIWFATQASEWEKPYCHTSNLKLSILLNNLHTLHITLKTV
jgi:hypothetical protein